MSGILFKFFGIAVLIIVTLYMIASAFRQSRRLNKRIRAFKEEQEELKRQGKVEDPYAGLAEIYAEQENERKKPRRPHQK